MYNQLPAHLNRLATTFRNTRAGLATALQTVVPAEVLQDLKNATHLELKIGMDELLIVYTADGMRREFSTQPVQDYTSHRESHVHQETPAEPGRSGTQEPTRSPTVPYLTPQRQTWPLRNFETRMSGYGSDTALMNFFIKTLRENYGGDSGLPELFFQRSHHMVVKPMTRLLHWLQPGGQLTNKLSVVCVLRAYEQILGKDCADELQCRWLAWADAYQHTYEADRRGEAMLRFAYAIVQQELPAQMPPAHIGTYQQLNRQIWEAILGAEVPTHDTQLRFTALVQGNEQRPQAPQPRRPTWSQQEELRTGPAQGEVTQQSLPVLNPEQFFFYLSRSLTNLNYHQAAECVWKLSKVYFDSVAQAAAARYFNWNINQSVEARLVEFPSILPPGFYQTFHDAFMGFLRSDVFTKPLPTDSIEKRRAAFMVLEFVKSALRGHVSVDAPGPVEWSNTQFWRQLLNGQFTERPAPVRAPTVLEARSRLSAWLLKHVPMIDADALPCVPGLMELLENSENSKKFLDRLQTHMQGTQRKVLGAEELEAPLRMYIPQAGGFHSLYNEYADGTIWHNPAGLAVLTLFMQALIDGLLPGQKVVPRVLNDRSIAEVLGCQQLWKIVEPSQIDPTLQRRQMPIDLPDWLRNYAFEHRLHWAQRQTWEAFQMRWNLDAMHDQLRELRYPYEGERVVVPALEELSAKLETMGLRQFADVYQGWVTEYNSTDRVQKAVLRLVDSFIKHELPGQTQPRGMTEMEELRWKNNRQVWVRALTVPVAFGSSEQEEAAPAAAPAQQESVEPAQPTPESTTGDQPAA